MMNKKSIGKRGGLTDIFIFMALAFCIALISIAFVYIGNVTHDKIQEKSPFLQEQISPEDNATQIIDNTIGGVNIAYQSLKWITGMLIVGMILSILISSFLVRVHPVFFVAYILISIIAVIVSVPLSNTYEVIYNDPVLASSFTGFYAQTFIFAYLPIWITAIMFIVGIVLFVNMQRRDEYAQFG